MRRRRCSYSLLLTALLMAASLFASMTLPGLASARAQTTEERFQDVFLTAGYCTAFGAAVGTAFLAWTDDPSANLKYVAMGASLGFIGGSIFGTYVVFSPMMADDNTPSGSTLLAQQQTLPDRGVVLRPVFNPERSSLVSVEAGMTLSRF